MIGFGDALETTEIDLTIIGCCMVALSPRKVCGWALTPFVFLDETTGREFRETTDETFWTRPRTRPRSVSSATMQKPMMVRSIVAKSRQQFLIFCNKAMAQHQRRYLSLLTGCGCAGGACVYTTSQRHITMSTFTGARRRYTIFVD